MKNIIHNLGLAAVLLLSLPIRADLVDIIILTDGKALITRITDLSADSLSHQVPESQVVQTIPLKELYYVYNDYGRIYWYSPSLLKRLDFIEQYPGVLYTIRGDTLPYRRISFDRQMTNPLAYLTIVAEEKTVKIPFLEIEYIRLHDSVVEQSIKKGFYAGSGLFLLAALLKFKSTYSENNNNGVLYSSQSIENLSAAAFAGFGILMPQFSDPGNQDTGKAYQSVTFFLPLATMIWMAADWFLDRRNVYINPLETRNPFPRSMIVYEPVNWTLKSVSKYWKKVEITGMNLLYNIRKPLLKD